MNTNVNYDIEFVKFIDKLSDLSQKNTYVLPKLLLHVCCAPCSTYCLMQVLQHFDVTLYYANDNITDETEWHKRLDELRKLVGIVNDGKFVVHAAAMLKLVVQPFAPERFFEAATGLETQPEGGARCTKCFTLRLTDTRDYARDHDYDYFGTTLTVSPYKNSRLLNEIGLSLATDNLQWLQSDFKKRNGYNQSIQLSAQYGIYRQHYCGCEFSKIIFNT